MGDEIKESDHVRDYCLDVHQILKTALQLNAQKSVQECKTFRFGLREVIDMALSLSFCVSFKYRSKKLGRCTTFWC